MSESHLPLKIMSFNIASGQTLDGRLDLKLTASAIEEADVDIAGLQEVDQHFSQRTDFTDQVKWLSKRLNMHAAFGPNLSINPTDSRWPMHSYGNALLSRHPIISFQNHLLEKVGSGTESEQRGLLEAIVEVDGVPIAFFNTHLSLRKRQLELNVEELLEIMRRKDMPVILTGDFNAEPNSAPMKRIGQEYTNVFGSAALYPETYKKQGDHGQEIDFIFCSRHWHVLHAGTVETEASDHRPVLAILQLHSET